MGLGAMLKSGRKAKGLTQREMADALGVDFTYISKIENDRERFSPSDALLSGWAALCDLDADDVFVAAGKCPPDLLERMRTDREFVRSVRGDGVMDGIEAIASAMHGAAEDWITAHCERPERDEPWSWEELQPEERDYWVEWATVVMQRIGALDKVGEQGRPI